MKYKFVKPFSSFKYSLDSNISTKDNWKIALRDPAYLASWVMIILFLLSIIFSR